MRLLILVFLVLCGLARAEPVKVDTSSLSHYNLNDLYAEYLAEGKLGKVTVIDFDANVKSMWNDKLNRARGVSGATEKNAQAIIARYSRAKSAKTDTAKFIRHLDHVAVRVRARMNWPALCGDSQIDLALSDCRLLQQVAMNIEGKDLLSYSMTELMPGANGVMNLRVLDVILRNAGREYLEVVPALYDEFLSYGWYQFTSYALYDDGRERRGASVVCKHSKDALPASVVNLRGDDHHRAAFCFAVYNIATLIRKMDLKETKKFSSLYEHRLDELVQYVAVAHHGPAFALRCARIWVSSGMAKGGFAKAITPKCARNPKTARRLVRYAEKTDGNMSAVYGFVKAGNKFPPPPKPSRQ